MLVTHHQGDPAKTELGVLAGGSVRRAPAELSGLTMLELLERWDALGPRLHGLDPAELDEVPGAVLVTPLRYPAAVLCAGANYHGHLAEMGSPRPEGPVRPYFFFKPPTTSVIGPDEPIVLPARDSRRIDWEIELAAVIGTRCADVAPERALDVVAGWTVVNDVSARDQLVVQDSVSPAFRHDWVAAKAADTFCPLGPGVVPSWLVEDPQDLRLRLSVNGEVQQDSSTADMITPITELIAQASRVVTLQPGDVVATGTPAGVGVARGKFLAPGDVVEAWIEGIGTLRNPVAGPAVTAGGGA